MLRYASVHKCLQSSLSSWIAVTHKGESLGVLVFIPYTRESAQRDMQTRFCSALFRKSVLLFVSDPFSGNSFVLSILVSMAFRSYKFFSMKDLKGKARRDCFSVNKMGKENAFKDDWHEKVRSICWENRKFKAFRRARVHCRNLLHFCKKDLELRVISNPLTIFYTECVLVSAGFRRF